MEEMENGKRYSAESKGYNDKIYEVRFLPWKDLNIRKAKQEKLLKS